MFQIVKTPELPVSFALAAILVPVRDSLGGQNGTQTPRLIFVHPHGNSWPQPAGLLDINDQDISIIVYEYNRKRKNLLK